MKDEQWNFMFKHYIEYCSAPYDMITWLYAQVKIHEDMLEAQFADLNVNENREEEKLPCNEYYKAFGHKS